MLTGNEVGVLLGHYLLTQAQTPERRWWSPPSSPRRCSAIAAAKGARYEETLTGFKWIANRAMELEAAGLHFVMGYEEALGYTVGDVVRDKDGVGAALVLADMAAWCKARGTTLLGYLEEVQREHGLFVASQFNATLPGTSGARHHSRGDGGLPQQAHLEHRRAARSRRPTTTRRSARQQAGATTALALPKSNVIAWELAGGQPRHPAPLGHRAEDQGVLRVARDAGGRRADGRGARARAAAALGDGERLPRAWRVRGGCRERLSLLSLLLAGLAHAQDVKRRRGEGAAHARGQRPGVERDRARDPRSRRQRCSRPSPATRRSPRGYLRGVVAGHQRGRARGLRLRRRGHVPGSGARASGCRASLKLRCSTRARCRWA